MSVLHGFFSEDVAAAVAAVLALEKNGPGAFDRSFGHVTNMETHHRVRGDDRLRFERNGLFAEHIFGPARDYECACGASSGRKNEGTTCTRCGVVIGPASLREKRFGHVEVKDIIHPLAFGALAKATATSEMDLRLVAHGKAQITDEGIVPLREDEDDARSGAPALVEWLRAKAPDHPALALCSFSKVPVPPPAERPMVTGLAPTMVDPWIGPLNALWVMFIERANRYVRLGELSAPEIILVNERRMLQEAFELLFERTVRPKTLVPPLARPVAADEREHMTRIAWLRDDALVLQQRTQVRALSLDGAVTTTLPPSACELRGITEDGVALFLGFLHGAHPYFMEAPCFGRDFAAVDDDGILQVRPHVEMSAIDFRQGRYLVDPPRELPRNLIVNDQPEDIFLEHDDGHAQKLVVGGDRPECFAYTRDLRFGWAGEIGASAAVFELATGIPHAMPIEPNDAEKVLDLASGVLRDPEEADEPEETGGAAVAFAGGEWRFVWGTGLYSDHRARRVVRFHPNPRAAAFDASGARLALVTDDDIAIVDVAEMRVLSRFALPATP